MDFPGVRALDGVDLEVQAGEVHAVVGENGAGKSTLLKVLGGVQRPTAGTIAIAGTPYTPTRAVHAQRAGIAVIYQEFNLFGDLTVAENVFAGREPHGSVSRGIRYRELRRRTAELFEGLGVRIDPDAHVADLAVSEQQMVEIAKALSFDGRIIVMDEPTAALHGDEVDGLLAIVRRLRDAGCGVVYVSHRLEEVFEVAGRATVLRDGALVRTLPVAETDPEELVRLMVGRDVASVFSRADVREGAPVLRLEGITAGRLLQEVDLEVHAGEVLGIGGLAGAGQTELTQVVFGALAPRAGSMTLLSQPYAPASPGAAIAAGVGFLHEDRKAAGLLPDLSVGQNLSLSVLTRLRRAFGRLLSPAAETDLYERYRDQLAIKAAGPRQPITTLSGGNQQKVLLGRALTGDARVLLLNEPTRGVDIGAKAEIHRLVNQLSERGTAVVMVSSDLPELLGMSDRIVVLAAGRVTGRLTGDDRTEERVVACATGGHGVGVAAA